MVNRSPVREAVGTARGVGVGLPSAPSPPQQTAPSGTDLRRGQGESEQTHSGGADAAPATPALRPQRPSWGSAPPRGDAPGAPRPGGGRCQGCGRFTQRGWADGAAASDRRFGITSACFPHLLSRVWYRLGLPLLWDYSGGVIPPSHPTESKKRRSHRAAGASLCRLGTPHGGVRRI